MGLTLKKYFLICVVVYWNTLNRAGSAASLQLFWRTPLPISKSVEREMDALLLLRLRGGADVNMDPSVANDVRNWKIEDVLKFIEGLRPKFGAKTDQYIELFKDNDIDGNVLITLNSQKLESVGIKSLGHREYLLDELQNLKASLGFMRGPKLGDFAAAMAAQNAPSAHPPVKIGTLPKDEVLQEHWEPASRSGWTEKAREIEYFLFLDGVGDVPKDALVVNISEVSIEVRVRGLNGTNYLHCIPKLYAPIRPEHSFWRVKKNAVEMLLYKAKDEPWQQMTFDYRKAERDAALQETMEETPEKGLFKMMENMWKDGDENTRRVMSNAWAQSQARQARGEAPGLGSGMPQF